jgi:SAM-dependent methyltransferase
MHEASKTKALWSESELKILEGCGIDIGSGDDPITDSVVKFDAADGDANKITEYVHEQFDFVFSSHCLEHMDDPAAALQQWWQLVKPGGYLVFLVPDEDLYEQGYWPSLFNGGHKATFTLSKRSSWSPRSYSMGQLVCELANTEFYCFELQDHGYSRRLLNHGCYSRKTAIRGLMILAKVKAVCRRLGVKTDLKFVTTALRLPYDQTATGALAQIQVIVKKVGPSNQ